MGRRGVHQCMYLNIKGMEVFDLAYVFWTWISKRGDGKVFFGFDVRCWSGICRRLYGGLVMLERRWGFGGLRGWMSLVMALEGLPRMHYLGGLAVNAG